MRGPLATASALLTRQRPRPETADIGPLRRCPSCGARFHPRFGRVCLTCAAAEPVPRA